HTATGNPSDRGPAPHQVSRTRADRSHTGAQPRRTLSRRTTTMEMIQEGTRIAQHEAARRAIANARNGEYLTFRLGAEEYGIDILRVQEIRSYEQPTRIANAPAFLK